MRLDIDYHLQQTIALQGVNININQIITHNVVVVAVVTYVSECSKTLF